MPQVKYFGAVRSAQKAQQTSPKLEPFDFSVLGSSGRLAQLAGACTQKVLLGAYALSRRYRPIFSLAGFRHVTGAAQVRDILLRSADFQVPFGPEMAELGQGATFMLGLDGPDHDRLRAILADVMSSNDAGKFAEMSRDFSTALLESSKGEIDVIGDLFKRVPGEICLRWFGFTCDDVDGFGDWTLAVSALLFGDPYGKPEIRRMGLNGARRLLIVIDDAIASTRRHIRSGHLQAGQGATLVERLVLKQAESGLSDAELRSMLLGMASGFIPTNTLAASRMLDVLMARKDAFAMAQDAALRGDEAAMRRIVLEAGRLSPALSPGQWRHCPKDVTLDVNGRDITIPAGTTLMASTQSAMRDAKVVADPKRFWPDRTGPDGRWQEPEMVFGFGPHNCIGKHLAMAQITALFMVLFRQPDLKRRGRMAWIGPFPRKQMMRFTAPASQQSMFMIIAPLLEGVSRLEAEEVIGELGFPANPEMRKALDATGLVHFSSIATIDAVEGSDADLRVVWELSTDGSKEQALDALVRHVGKHVWPVFALCGAQDLRTFLAEHIVDVHGAPWGPNGLNYNGLSEFPVQAVEKQARFAKFAEKVVIDFLSSQAGKGSHPMLALTYLRRILSQDRILALNGTDAQRALMAKAAKEKFDAMAMKPAGAGLKMTAFRPVTFKQGLFAFLKSRDALPIWLPLLALLGGFALYFWGHHTSSTSPNWDIVAVILRTLFCTLITAAAIVGGFFALLRGAEKTDWIDTSQASTAHIAALGQHEDVPGFAQNHIMAVGTLKDGMLRTFTHALAMWAIKVLITYNYRPGFILTMGTIHYARWWRLPGTRRVAFYSNFDGSWENYLEDFIMRAHVGQTAAWSNWKGFPPTRFLVLDGAENGDRFKRWERTAQRLVPFWYSRFPTLTSDQIRNNALIHAGVTNATSQDEAREWLRCFGSMPLIENRIESDEVQGLVFSGLKRLKFSASIVVQLPPAGEKLGEWLSWIRGETMALNLPQGHEPAATGDLVNNGVLVPDGRNGYCLAHSLTVTFGDRPIVGDASIYDMAPAAIDPESAGAVQQFDARRMVRRAVFLGCSAAGMTKFTPPNSEAGSMADTFPPAFRMGMAERGRNLGDLDGAAAEHWRWSDGKASGQPAEAVLMVYCESADDLAFAADVHRQLIENHGGRVLHQLDCTPARLDAPEDQHDFEHFGYRDGIAQPVIKGTTRSVKHVPPRDLLEPGEFILGYANGQGFFPNSCFLPPEADSERSLPQLAAADLSRFPDFDARHAETAPCDFGRNGTYLVIRELAQDVDGFEDFVARKAEELKGTIPSRDGNQPAYRDLYRLIGQYPDKDWVKAKLMGRWPNGRPLIGNPVNTPTPNAGDPDAAACRAAELENDFSFGADDPQGLACPFGSHIRRTNPRDSKQPGDAKEQTITNRHRLLRRGRTYTRSDASGASEKGLLFVSLCTDLERQFEFVQQIWSNAPGFHGLHHEPDPIIGADIPDVENGGTAPRCFTIPTPAGPIKLTGMQNFVSVKAGGYFFMPSRSALNYLTTISYRNAETGKSE